MTLQHVLLTEDELEEWGSRRLVHKLLRARVTNCTYNVVYPHLLIATNRFLAYITPRHYLAVNRRDCFIILNKIVTFFFKLKSMNSFMDGRKHNVPYHRC